MIDIIHLLPDHVANQIAAGEVIQRPASCLKELVENALDAQASHIQILIRDAGRTMLQVIDDGIGMSPTDARMAFERHATSKIQQAADLFSLHTMGFRGEALASICAVAQVEMQTRRTEDEVGSLIEISGSELVRQEPTQCRKGTSIKVKNLFFNVPARRKFLKTDATEMRNMMQEFHRIVLVYPHVQFTLVSNDEILIDLPAGTEKQRIEQIFGSRRQTFTEQVVDVNVQTELVSIHGFVGKPELAQKQPQQYFFVNGRYMRHAYFHKAVQTAFAGLLPSDTSPSYFLYFDINPADIDVNVHPSKTEIKFRDEQIIFQILMAAVRESLGKFNVTPSLDFDVEGRIEMPIQDKRELSSSTIPHITLTSDYNPFRPTPVSRDIPKDWQQLYEPTIKPSSPTQTHSLPLFQAEISVAEPSQYAERYILLPTTGGLMLIDQHRAHACVLYNLYIHQMKEQPGIRQQLLFPEVWEVTPDIASQVTVWLNDLQDVGFDIEQLTPTSFTLSAVPSSLNGKNAITVLQQVVDNVDAKQCTLREQWQQQIALQLAMNTAITAGSHLSDKEMKDLLHQLFALPDYRHLPDGKTIVTLLTDDEISHRFH